jgi:RND family efflux transporter MFP subunit
MVSDSVSYERRMKRKRLVFVVLLGVAVFGVFMLLRQQPAITRAMVRADSAKRHVVSRETLRQTFALSGKVDAKERVSLAFQTGGRLAWVGVKEGDVVKKSQAIASLDVRQLQKDIQKRLNDYQTARWNFDQTKQDNKNADVTTGDMGDRMRRLIDLAQYGLNNAVLNLEIATLSKEYAYLTTPIDGIVTRVDAPFAGVNIPMGTTYEVVNPSTLYFVASADQTEVPKISIGQEAILTLDAYPDERISAIVKHIGFTPKTGEGGTLYDVEIEFGAQESRSKYRVGMTGDAEFVMSEKKEVLTVPLGYVRIEQEKKYVTKLENGRLVKTEVVTGIEGDDAIEVISGLREGDVVVEQSR